MNNILLEKINRDKLNLDKPNTLSILGLGLRLSNIRFGLLTPLFTASAFMLAFKFPKKKRRLLLSSQKKNRVCFYAGFELVVGRSLAGMDTHEQAHGFFLDQICSELAVGST